MKQVAAAVNRPENLYFSMVQFLGRVTFRPSTNVLSPTVLVGVPFLGLDIILYLIRLIDETSIKSNF